jgi:predicted metal-binding membrane protein
MPDPEITESSATWEAEVKAMSDRLASQSRRSGIIGFLGGMVVMGGLVILAWGIMTQVTKNKTLTTEVQTQTAQATDAKQKAATFQQQATTVKTVLSTTVENLQSQNGAISASATSALDQAFEADPNAAKLLVRVYIHIHDESQRRGAQQVARALRNAGYIVPGIDLKPQAVKISQVHYYANDSQSLSDADGIAKAAATAGIQVTTRQVPPAATDKLKPRAYGLWLAANSQ